MSIFGLAANSASRMAHTGQPMGAIAAIAAPAAEPAAQQPASALANAISSLTTFIPAETITLFVAITGIVSGWKTPTNPETNAFVGWFLALLVISPVFYVVSTILTARAASRKFTITASVVWRFAALMIAFVVWACAISSDTLTAILLRLNIDANLPHLRDIVSIIVLLTSAVLSTIDGLFPQ